MAPSGWRKLLRHSFPASRPGRRRPRTVRPQCEALEDRSLPSVSPFTFNTGNPDGKIATISEPANTQNGNVEYESADDFVLSTETQLNSATFTGLLTGGATPADVSSVDIEIYRVFPKDSNTARNPAVPTRANSPSDVVLVTRDSAAAGQLTFTTNVLNGAFTAQNSVSSQAAIAVNSGGNGMVTGQEVQFSVTFTTPLDLPADHYFFVPQVALNTGAPGNFLWLSAPKPITAPGTAFTPDLQSWMRDDPPLAPDWLRIGTDIVGGNPAPTFNAAFSLAGQAFTPQITSLSRTSAVEGSGNITLTVNGSDFTSQSTVLFNGNPLATTFVSASQLTATVPASFLTDEGTANVGVSDAQRGLSNRLTFTVLDHAPTVTAFVSQDRSLLGASVVGIFSDSTAEGHRAIILWGDGTMSTVELGTSSSGFFSAAHRYRGKQPSSRQIVVFVLDDEGTPSVPVVLTISFRRGRHSTGSRHAAG